MKNKLNIMLIPADDRPVSYILPCQIAKINENVNIFIPPREFLGNLTQISNINAVFQWTESIFADNTIDYVICALDTIAYGGLIPSRRSNDLTETIISRLENFKRLAEVNGAKLLGFSSIMRISNNNINEEEKIYWDKYGELIFRYSYLSHELQAFPERTDLKDEVDSLQVSIPKNILEDYLNTRERNFSVNKHYLNWLEQGFFDYLVYAKDDTAPFGLNVRESNELAKFATVHTGFDEVLVLLLARVIVQNFSEKIRICPIYSTLGGRNIIPRYEDTPLHVNISNHIRHCGLYIAESKEDADVILLIHTPEKTQNELALEVFVEPESKESIDFCLNFIKNTNKPVILADVKNANGSDNSLMQEMFNNYHDLYGYAGWNTASNTIGTALSMGVMRYIAEKTDAYSFQNFKTLMFTRFMDDWAYQTVIRKIMRKLGMSPTQITLNFPWDRTFEAEIDFLQPENEQG